MKNSEYLLYGERENNEKDVDSHKNEKPKMLSQSKNYTWSEKETRIIGSESPKIIGGTFPGLIILIERILYVLAKNQYKEIYRKAHAGNFKFSKELQNISKALRSIKAISL